MQRIYMTMPQQPYRSRVVEAMMPYFTESRQPLQYPWLWPCRP